MTDNEGKEITRFQTAHLEMGFFYLKPEMGKTYSAKLSFGDGSAFTVSLPPAVETGMTLSIDEAADSAIIHILSSDAWSKTHQGEEVILLIYSNGASSITRVLLTAADMAFGIDKRQLHSGIARVTLFTTRGEPVSERLLFIRMPDQLRLGVNTDKQEYAKREKVVISLNAKDAANAPAQANFSVAVVNGDVISANEQDNILTHILLTSGIKGFVEQPDYYLARPGPDVDANPVAFDSLLTVSDDHHKVLDFHDALYVIYARDNAGPSSRYRAFISRAIWDGKRSEIWCRSIMILRISRRPLVFRSPPPPRTKTAAPYPKSLPRYIKIVGKPGRSSEKALFL